MTDGAAQSGTRVESGGAHGFNEAHGFNAVNRGVYIADNLSFLRSLNDECIDLVCIDPPFAKNDTFTGDRIRPALSAEEREIERRLLAGWGVTSAREAEAAGIVWPDGELQGGYRDIWSWEGDIHEEWLTGIEDEYPAVHSVIEMARLAHGDSLAAYLCYMAIRLLEIRRVLKATGSIFLHCDQTAGAYLHQMLDAVFGADNHVGEIVWKRTSSHNDARRFGHITDYILFYAKTERRVWNHVLVPHDEDYVSRFYRHEDERGRYRLHEVIRTASMGPRPNLAYEYEGYTPQYGWRMERDGLEALNREGRLVWSETGRPYRKTYLTQGRYATNLWDDINNLSGQARERTGYPTQKPVALAERIIAASTNPGDVVLDCFAGCAYAGVAAERLGRQWVACDFNPRAWTVFKRQFNKPSLALLRCNDETTGQQVLGNEPIATVHGPTELPTRTSPEVDVAPQGFVLPERRFKVPASIIPEREMLEMLLELSGYMAWCCGYANRMPDGSIIRTTRNFHLDHIAPRSREGTSNEIQNRAPMCPYHNIRKNNRQIALSQYRQEIADAGEMMVNSVNDLINLDYALARAMEMYGQAYAARTGGD